LGIRHSSLSIDADGALIVDKPSGMTSHDVVAVARRALGTSRIGHTGTLDPLATGVLVLLVGRATRLCQFLVADEKEYVADVRLGVSTPTYDAEGLGDFRLKAEATEPPQNTRGFRLQAEEIDAALNAFRGTFMQTPPPFSAKKVAGRRAYEHARRQEPVDLKPVQVTVSELERLATDDPLLLRLRVVVTSGFYVRSLAHDIGQRLGCGAHLEGLRRTRVGTFALVDAVSLEQLSHDRPALLPLSRLLAHVPALTLSEDGERRVEHGNTVAPHQVREGLGEAGAHARVRLLRGGGDLLAIAEVGPDALLHPQVVLV
jgi:tRNA pseudouridine55 synthase